MGIEESGGGDEWEVNACDAEERRLNELASSEIRKSLIGSYSHIAIVNIHLIPFSG